MCSMRRAIHLPAVIFHSCRSRRRRSLCAITPHRRRKRAPPKPRMKPRSRSYSRTRRTWRDTCEVPLKGSAGVQDASKWPVAAGRSAANILCGGQWLPALLGYIGIVFVMFSGVRRLDLRQNKGYGADPEYQAYVKSAPSFCRSSCSIAWQSADSLRHK